ncbi:hypothetical protein EMIHUDRAFT_353391 [Emiliania huxleyi CCMP1516]|uniref:Uncharacterized protein n=2 Tax=Emiliania huxleyi TaxID=2903 RepID=A0A0D3JXW6_EMIH1|nr:hypothetical protein EMIHUDRAFT_353391 [Emiliania huxleyi CCMP1516]EOD28351.1 hypothetical protein EMIHUDRAFT_353391 [Emiliania huxleyi CCMP1516]|eukprot:XP_005780780.1 hypothetical protein EMIHUDRAFT_353391 [Emiliania huxleyi CCMP1516]
MPTSNHQRQERRAAARRASVATDDVPDAVPRPQGRGPRNHFWDPRPPGVWRHNESNEPYQSRAARLASARSRHAAAVRGRRWSRINAARCTAAPVLARRWTSAEKTASLWGPGSAKIARAS